MKINLLNKIYIAIAVGLVVAIISKTLNHKGWERYYYASSVCTPKSNPIYLHGCHFLTADPNDDAWIKTENVNNFSSEWGDEVFLETHEPMRLPQKLVLQYASYGDRKFYSDTLDLPENEIKQIFETAKQNKNLENLYSARGDVKGLHFLVGIARQGNIIVWLRGVDLEKVILKSKLHSKEPQGDETYYEQRLDKDVYLEKVFADLSDSLKTKIRDGWDANANYIDTPTYYIEKNSEMWQYQKKNKFIE